MNLYRVEVILRSLSTSRTSHYETPQNPPLCFPWDQRLDMGQGDLRRADETRKPKRRVDSESDGLPVADAAAASAERPVLAEFQRLCRAPHVVPWIGWMVKDGERERCGPPK